jgi:hypothetical protein
LVTKTTKPQKIREDKIGPAYIERGRDGCKHVMYIDRDPGRHNHLIGVCTAPGCGRTVDYTILQEGVPLLSMENIIKRTHERGVTYEALVRGRAKRGPNYTPERAEA